MRRAYGWLAIVILPCLIALFVAQTISPYEKIIGTLDDEIVLDSFFNVEQSKLETFRWAQDGSAMVWPSQMLPGIFQMRASAVPNGAQVVIQLPSGQRLLIPRQEIEVRLRTYHVYVPEYLSISGTSGLQVITTKSGPLIEERPINLVLTSFGFQPINNGFQWPPLWPWLLLSLIPLVWVALILEVNLPRWSAYLSGLIIGIGLSLHWAWHPLWSFTWLGPFFGLLLVLWLLLHWAKWSNSRLSSGEFTVALILIFGAIFAGFQYIKYGDYQSLQASFYWRHWALWIGVVMLGLPLAKTRSRIWFTVCSVLVILVGFKYAHVFASDYADDFKVLFRGPRAFLQGKNLYDVDAIQSNVLSNLYKYPPFFVFIMGPLTGLPFVPAIQTWRAINLAMLAISALILWRTYRRPAKSWSSVGLLALVALFQPLYDTLRYGQVDLLLLMVLAGALWALVRNRLFLWGFLITLATAIKLYPAYLGIQALVRSNKRGLAGMGIGGIVLAGLSITILGWNVHQIYLADVLPISGAGTAWIENQTLNGLFARWSTSRIALEPLTMTWLRIATYSGLILVTACTWWRACRLPTDTAFGLWIVTLLIIIPAAWIHYQAILLIPFYQWLIRFEQRKPEWRSIALYCLAWALLAVGNQWTFFERLYYGPVWASLLSYKLYGLLLLWAAIGWDSTAQAIPATDVPSAEQQSCSNQPKNQQVPSRNATEKRNAVQQYQVQPTHHQAIAPDLD